MGHPPVPSQPPTHGGHQALLGRPVLSQPSQAQVPPPLLWTKMCCSMRKRSLETGGATELREDPQVLKELELLLLGHKCPSCDSRKRPARCVPLVRDRPIRGPGVLGYPIRRAGAGFEPCPIRVRGRGAPSSQSRGRARSGSPGLGPQRREALVCTCPARRQVSSVCVALTCAGRAVTRRTPAEPGAGLTDGECVGSADTGRGWFEQAGAGGGWPGFSPSPTASRC